MSQASKVTKHFGTLSVDNLKLQTTHITQGTAITSGVTMTTDVASILTVSSSLATNGTTSFAVTHPTVSSNSIIFATINGYSGNGNPRVHVNNIASGSFSLVLTNSSDTAPLSAALKLAVQVIE